MIPAYQSVSGAYLGVIGDLLRVSESEENAASPRGIKIHEILGYHFRVKHPDSGPVVTHSPERNVKIAEYLKKEIELYDSGTLQAEDFARASKFWLKIKNPDGTINSNYGAIIRRMDLGCVGSGGSLTPFKHTTKTGWEWARDALLDDKDSRQAIIHISRPEFLWPGNKDQVCTMYLQFFIRNDLLELHWNMRSNDVVKGLVYDISYAALLQERMRDALIKIYPRLKLGHLVWFAGSMHLYDNDVATVKEMLGKDLFY